MRLNEIDFLKGIAVILMNIFHFLYFGEHMKKININTSSGIFKYMAKIIQFIFITCMGINYHYSLKKNNNFSNCIKRFLRLISVASFISMFTYLTFGYNLFIKFGIFHFMSVCSLILYFFANKPKLISIIIPILIIFNLNLHNFNFNFNKYIEFILGLSTKFSSLDHFPILKWIPLALVGLLIGYHLDNNNVKSKLKKDNFFIKNICYLGTKSMEIYIIHIVLIYYFLKLFL